MNKDQKHKIPNFPSKEAFQPVDQSKLSPLEQAIQHEKNKLKK